MQVYEKSTSQIKSFENSLRNLDPNNVLNRGYSIVTGKTNNEIITKTNQLKIGDLISITIRDGNLEAKTTKIDNYQNKDS